MKNIYNTNNEIYPFKTNHSHHIKKDIHRINENIKNNNKEFKNEIIHPEF